MKIAIAHQNDILTVTLEGVLDYTSSNQMESLIGDLKVIKSSRVVFDLAKVPRVDSVGLGMLHLAKDTILEHGATMVLSGAVGNVQRLFELTDSSQSFEIQK
ncbi:anti-sigma factor antagonist [Paramagnetospirillum kuznetsovii]|uniref:Anti-sigma factor antagonist n=1 Tax=Paramagnetospirillum kuznetsovii TaxID=2053833 RepID=A0A364NSX0_9PROT|nr:STAS domain-containing protein [Paramagnetospirillum kuznetsovii]RAU20168.1 anti-sigma factor antagonist [Paramagnetospirillum kuznetsovii]